MRNRRGLRRFGIWGLGTWNYCRGGWRSFKRRLIGVEKGLARLVLDRMGIRVIWSPRRSWSGGCRGKTTCRMWTNHSRAYSSQGIFKPNHSHTTRFLRTQIQPILATSLSQPTETILTSPTRHSQPQCPPNNQARPMNKLSSFKTQRWRIEASTSPTPISQHLRSTTSKITIGPISIASSRILTILPRVVNLPKSVQSSINFWSTRNNAWWLWFKKS